MSVITAWRSAVPAVAIPVLVAGAVAWVFPREIGGAVGSWVLPALSVISLVLSLGLTVAEWRRIAVPLGVLAVMLLVAWNPASVTSTSHFAGVCFGLLTMLVIAREANDPSRLRLAALGFLAAGTAMLVLGLAGAGAALARIESVLQVGLPTRSLGLAGLPQGGDVNENALGAAALLIAPLGIAVLVTRMGGTMDRLLKPVGLAAISVAAVAMTISLSRSAWIALWLTLVGVLVYGVRSRVARLAVGVAIVLPLFVALAAVVSVNQRTLERAVASVSSSARSRAPIMTQGLDRLQESPWLGIGLNEYRAVYYPREDPVPHAHNIVLQTALDVGAIGSIAYWGLLGCILVIARQAVSGSMPLARAVAAGSAASLVASTLFGVVDAVPLGAKIGVFQWMACGLILAAWRMTSAVEAEHPLRPSSP